MIGRLSSEFFVKIKCASCKIIYYEKINERTDIVEYVKKECKYCNMPMNGEKNT